MSSPVFRAVLRLLLLGISLPCLATHQVGGQLEMRAVGDVPGHFRIIVTNYLEDNARGANQRGGGLGIFRKRDNQRMLVFYVEETGTRSRVVFTNEACATARNQRVVVAVFEADVQLDPAEYTDSQGYYISYQTQFRNNGINNIENPARTGFTFYLEFPPLQRNGQLFNNSSPHFGNINGEYICVGEPFTFPFGGKDPDGDELRYSMVTPLDQLNSGNGNGNGNGPGNQAVSAGPYPEVRWASGFSAGRAIPGSPALSVDPQSGRLSVTATQLGLFVFAVRVEEFRNGQKIGEVRREFQLLVIDCPPVQAPTPDVWAVSQPAGREFTVCKGNRLTLQTTANANWNYQWRRDGINLDNATGTTLAVDEPGDYSVVVSLKTECGKASGSQSVRVNFLDLSAPVSVSGQLCATDGTVRLGVPAGTDRTYEWFRNNQPVSGQTGNELVITQPGQYQVVLKQAKVGCTYRAETIPVDRAPAVRAVLRAEKTNICPGATVTLQASGGVSYSWQRDGQTLGSSPEPVYNTQAPGSYVVTATAENGCTGTSGPLVLEAIPGIQVSLVPLPGVCGTDAPAMTLSGSPAGGTFSGPGVTGNQFNPKAAGIGEHELTYTVNFSPECPGAVARRTAVVAPIPTIGFSENIITSSGSSITISPVLTGNPVTFEWSPPLYISNPTEANANVVGIEDDMTYTLQVRNATGCLAEASVVVTVYERIWVPAAFSPNGDGQNDLWELKGVEAFPEVEVTVFNRWGEVVYHSKDRYAHPFDGTMKGQALTVGGYAWTIRYAPGKPLLRGSLMLLR
ncbi:T9SS type B sorting domain-containing protein [Larkinella soli]|uniref:T9SS type B sorting domain-containing protein n=1 Tax=Larkinella soli TaxID=1770527 RepID=UPI000FFCB010|nr:gliding motility-associated C-terminal domain-containing protein [Larkinella soli]